MPKAIPLYAAFLLCLLAGTLKAQVTSEIDSLERVLKTAKEDSGKVRILITLGSRYKNTGNINNALKYAGEALALSQKINYKKGEASALNNLGVLCKDQGRYDEALKNHKEALKIREGMDNKRLTAESYTNMALVYVELGNNAEALKYNFAAVRELNAIDDRRALMSVNNNIGNIYRDQGNYPEALKYYLEALKTSEEFGDRKVAANVHSNIGLIYKEQGNYSEALNKYLLALELREEIGDKKGISISYTNIGVIYLLTGNYAEALKNHFASLKIKEASGDLKGIGTSYMSIGDVYFHQGDYTHAYNSYDTALFIMGEIRNKQGMAEGNVKMAQLQIRLNNFVKAGNYLKEGLTHSQAVGNKELLMECYASLALLDSALGNYQPALENYKMHVLYKDSLLNEVNSQQIARMKTQYETEKKDREIETLNRENEFKALQLKQGHTAMLASRLDAERKRNEISLLSKTGQLQKMALEKQNEELDKNHLEAQAKDANLKRIAAEKELQAAELSKQKTIRNLGMVIFALVVISGALAFKRFRQDQVRKGIEERARISRDLHDEIGASLSSIHIMSAFAGESLDNSQPDAKQWMSRIGENTKVMMEKMRDIVWTLNPAQDHSGNIIARMNQFISHILEPKNIACRFTADEKAGDSLNGFVPRRNVYLIFKEAVNNAAKYSECSEMNIVLKVENRSLHLTIADNGKGFDSVHQDSLRNNGMLTGNGLYNMRQRAAEINGTINIQSSPGKGTSVDLVLPLPQLRYRVLKSLS